MILHLVMMAVLAPVASNTGVDAWSKTRTDELPAGEVARAANIDDFESSPSLPHTSAECPAGTYDCGSEYCTPVDRVCCATAGHPELSCPSGSTCTSDGHCTTGGGTDPGGGGDCAAITQASCGGDVCGCASSCASGSECSSGCCSGGYCAFSCVCAGQGSVDYSCDDGGGGGGSPGPGGGGCQASPGSSGAAMLGMFGVAIFGLLVRPRRRRR